VGDLGRQRDIVVATQPDAACVRAADRLLATRRVVGRVLSSAAENDAVNAEISRIPILPIKSSKSRGGL
jgi:hypothetical protein